MITVAFLALSFLLVLVLLLRIVVMCNNAKHQKLLPPSPPTLPFIGNLHQLISINQNSLHALSIKYGPVMLLHLGQIPTLVVSSPEMAQEVMKTQDDIFASRPLIKASHLLLYGGKNVGFAPYGEYWKRTKKLYTVHLLGSSKVKSFELVRQEEVQSAIEEIRRAQNLSIPVDLSEMFSSFTLDILCRVVSKNFSKKHKIRQLIEDGTALFGEFNFQDYFPALHFLDIFLNFDSKAKKISMEWDDLLEEIITENLSNEEDGDFINILLSLQASKQADFDLTKEHIKAILLDMFGAGSHTTFIALEWVMAELIKNPKAMQKLQQEIHYVAENKEIITEEDLKKMNWLKAVVKETLRLHPPAPLLVPRESLQQSQINGYEIPKGTKVLINAWSISRDPKYWQNPTEFLPERFMEKENTTMDFRGNSFQLIPFGSGRRICPGINFAIQNIELIIANMLLHFNWELPCDMTRAEFDMTEAPGLTARRNKKLYLVPSKICTIF